VTNDIYTDVNQLIVLTAVNCSLGLKLKTVQLSNLSHIAE